MAPCERIPYPTKEEATFAACIIFSYLSEKEIPHAFIGRFAEAMTSTVPVEMDVLEILVEHGLGEIETLFNDLVSGRNTRYSGFLASTDDSERCPIALVYRLGHRHHHMGVALSFVRAGSNMFPYKLDHGNNDSTCVKVTVPNLVLSGYFVKFFGSYSILELRSGIPTLRGNQLTCPRRVSNNNSHQTLPPFTSCS